MTITLLPHSGNKDFKKIKQFITSTKIVNIVKQVTS